MKVDEAKALDELREVMKPSEWSDVYERALFALPSDQAAVIINIRDQLEKRCYKKYVTGDSIAEALVLAALAALNHINKDGTL